MVKKIMKKAFVKKDECVACGACQKICPLKAISIVDGSYSYVDFNKCVGCGKCSLICPASVIEIMEVNE